MRGVQVQALPREAIESLDIRVDRRAHLMVELADPAHADAFALLDDAGRRIELSVFEGRGRSEGEEAAIVGGRSPVVAGSDRARTLVILRGGAEVGRRDVVLRPGETTAVTW